MTYDLTDLPKGLVSDPAIAFAQGRRQERQRAEMVLRGVGPDAAAVEEWGEEGTAPDEAFAMGFEHCRDKALTILRGGAESWRPDAETREADRSAAADNATWD